MPMLVAADADSAKQALAEELHEILFWLLAALVAGHVSMVVWHHRNGIALLPRLLPASGVSAAVFAAGLALVTAALVAWALSAADVLGKRDASSVPANNEKAAHLESPTQLDNMPAVDVPEQWRSVPGLSKLEFVGEYLGVAFVGQFTQFDVRLQFDPANPAAGVLYVSVDVTSASTGSADMDAMLPDPAWFHFGKYPRARFYSEQIFSSAASASDSGANGTALSAGRFRAQGALLLKGYQRPLAIPFTWKVLPGGQAHMQVETSVNRRDYAIGSGEWADDDSIGFNVNVRAEVVLEQLPAN
ncbi:MAG: hypothetical protein HKO60_07415 [Pseudomonadales bacterium]|nr:hypothetical protein [Pseudomonadales bacterium]